DDIPEAVKKRRNNELLAVQSEICALNNAEMVGRTVEVMVEGTSKLVSKRAYPAHNVELGWEKRRRGDEGEVTTQLTGRTRGDQVVVFDGEASLVGQLLEVEITSARNMTLFARLPAAAVA